MRQSGNHQKSSKAIVDHDIMLSEYIIPEGVCMNPLKKNVFTNMRILFASFTQNRKISESTNNNN